MNIYQILETLRRVEESIAQIGDRVQCPNDITGTIVSDAGSHWIVIDDHAETEDDTLEFRKSDCQVINGLGEGQMKHEMMDNAERMDLEQFKELYGDDDWVEDFWRVINDEPEVLKNPGDDPIATSKDTDWSPERRAAAAKKGDWPMDEGKDLTYKIFLHDRKGELKGIEYRSADYGDANVASDCRGRVRNGWQVKCTKNDKPFDWKSIKEHGYGDIPGARRSTGDFAMARSFKLKDRKDYLDQRDAIYKALTNTALDAVTRSELKQKLQGIEMAAKMAGLQEGTKFAFANPKQRPGDQVRGTEVAKKKKSGEHPFKGRLVGAMESEQVTDEAKATSQRLDPKCWKGKKIGNPKTKVKGGVRVNNCVPVEEEYEQFMNELVNTYGMTSGGTAMGNTQKPDPETAKEIASVTQSVNKLRNAGANIPSGTQAVQSLMKDPVKDPQSQLDKTIDAGLGQEVQKIVDKLKPSDIDQLTNLVRKANQQSGA